MPTPVLASKIIHEMFHAFQNRQGWECFAKEMEALYKYKYSEECFGISLIDDPGVVENTLIRLKTV